jgi:hypothetical protein
VHYDVTLFKLSTELSTAFDRNKGQNGGSFCSFPLFSTSYQQVGTEHKKIFFEHYL